jgi:hypothetical protein
LATHNVRMGHEVTAEAASPDSGEPKAMPPVAGETGAVLPDSGEPKVRTPDAGTSETGNGSLPPSAPKTPPLYAQRMSHTGRGGLPQSAPKAPPGLAVSTVTRDALAVPALAGGGVIYRLRALGDPDLAVSPVAKTCLEEEVCRGTECIDNLEAATVAVAPQPVVCQMHQKAPFPDSTSVRLFGSSGLSGCREFNGISPTKKPRMASLYMLSRLRLPPPPPPPCCQLPSLALRKRSVGGPNVLTIWRPPQPRPHLW